MPEETDEAGRDAIEADMLLQHRIAHSPDPLLALALAKFGGDVKAAIASMKPVDPSD